MSNAPASSAATPVVLLMGVSGSGKTTIGTRLADRLGWRYADADDFHPVANVAKMAAGSPLTDADRAPWLAAIGQWIDDRRAEHTPAVVTCSALRRRYRIRLRQDRPDLLVVHLHGDRSLIADRLSARHGHFFAAGLLDSQFQALEPPRADEDVLTVSVASSPAEVVDLIITGLRLRPEPVDRVR